MQPFGLDEEIALITGGGSGLGLAIARAMAEAGARVILVGRREGPLREAAESIGERAAWLAHDVTQLEEADALMARAGREVGAPTILVNNAGIHIKKPALETTDREMQQVLETHLLGAFALTRAAVPAMQRRGRGSVLFISSMAALFGIPQVVAYTAAKTALTGLIHNLAVELSPSGVRVNGIAPGWIETAMMRQAMEGDPERRDKILSRTPMQRFGTPEDVGWAAVYLCAPAGRFVTGVILPVDGGVSVGF